MIIDSRVLCNHNAHKKPFRYLSYDKDRYAFKEDEREQLFWELVDAFAKTPGVIAIGGCGLDYHDKREEPHRLKQCIWFSFNFFLIHCLLNARIITNLCFLNKFN